MPESENAGWAAALGKIPSGLFVLTATTPSGETGLLVSWVQQCSFDPPQVTLAINRERPLLPELQIGTSLVLNILAEGSKVLVAHFGRGVAPSASAFDGLVVERRPGRAPRLAEALAWLDAQVVAQHEVGDHVLLVARIVDGMIQHSGTPTVHIRRDGRRY